MSSAAWHGLWDMTNAVETGYVPVGDLNVYYEIYGDGGFPLLLLHGGLFDIEQQFGTLIPVLSEGRRVVALDFQGHGRTNDIDRPLSASGLAADVVAVLAYLGLEQVDIFGFSVGGAVALELAVEHPELIRKAIISSTSLSPDGQRAGNAEAVPEMTVDLIAGTPMEQVYLTKSPHPDHEHLQELLNKLGGTYERGFPGYTDEQIQAIAAPTLITVGDCDMVTLEHAVKLLRLRGGDVNGDFEGVPASQLAVFPGTTHFFGLARTELVLASVIPFLDAA
jgi:pimeloyl-ACP methyl ester carboxylesterase